MTPIEIFQILRRRWYVVGVAIVVGFVAGYATAPGEDTGTPSYRATTTLISNPTLFSGQQARYVNLDQAALLVTTGEVPRRVAKAMGEPVPSVLSGVVATPDAEISSLTVSATDQRPARAEQTARLLSDELINRLSEGDKEAYDDAVALAQEQVQEQKELVAELRSKVGPNPLLADPVDLAALQAGVQDLTSATSALTQTRLAARPTPFLIVVDYGSAGVVRPDGIRPPDGKVARGLLFALVGGLAGLLGAVFLDRLDTRLRSRDQLELALGVPVLAEIPSLPMRHRSKHNLLAHAGTSSSFMEAYRGVRTALTLEVGYDSAARLSRSHQARGSGTVVLITSAGPSEGKSTTAAHLAAALGEVGRSVLLVSADFRRPSVHEFYGVPIEPGLSELIREPSTSLTELMVSTPIPGVRMLPSGSPVENPAPLLETVSELLSAAKKVFDFVVVDTAPVLVASDALGLLPAADEVILLARVGRTSEEAAQRLAEVMQRLDAPILGSVLVGVRRPSGTYYRYRSSDGAGRNNNPGRRGNPVDQPPIEVPRSSSG